MKDLELAQGLKSDVESNQNVLKTAIRNHQALYVKLKADPDNLDLQKELKKAEQEVVSVGLAQKALLEKLREERKSVKGTKDDIVKTCLQDKRFNLSSALIRARKQNIHVSRSTSVSISSISDDSVEAVSANLSPEEQPVYPVNPHDVTQSEFLTNFFLCTHDVFKELQNKRVERKRRSTANPQFLYGSKGWDYPKRKRNAYLFSSISPPNTRQSVKKKTTTTTHHHHHHNQNISERTSPPTTPSVANGNGNGNSLLKSAFATFPAIPNLPSGLTIERVSPSSSSPDSKVCITCRQPGCLSICESCTNGFHISCHNRPLTHSPRQCPRCIIKELRTVGSLNVPSGMSVSYVTPSEVSEKLEEKIHLEAVNKTLYAELTQLQDRHSQLTISLKNQKTQQDELMSSQQTTEEKIKQILTFISSIKIGGGGEGGSEETPSSSSAVDASVAAAQS